MPDKDLIDFVTAVSGDSFLKVEENLGEGFVRLRVSEAERRQAKHDIRSVEDIVVELLRNARDAHAQRIFVATSREGDTRSITVLDDGVGVPEGMKDLIFEPRVTSKLDTMVMDSWGVHGRGMALFSIRSNTERADVVCTAPHKGTAVTVVAHTSELAERKDQSSWPTLERDENGMLRVAKGPHNIARRVVEFALEHSGLDVFLGSPAEVLTTLFMLARFEMDESELLFCDEPERLAVWQRPGACADASELTKMSADIGVPVSERTAHRVVAGDIVPLNTVMSVLSGTKKEKAGESAVADIFKDRRGLKIHHGDLQAFRTELEHAFDTIGERYYLHLKTEPKITVGKDEIRVRFEVEKED